MRIYFSVFLVMCICFSAETKAIPEYTKDGRMGTKCMPKFKNSDTEYCIVSVTQLAVTPERYHGKHVRVTARLLMEFEVTGIEFGEHKIWLDIKNYQKFKDLNSKTVQVEGIFNAFNSGHFGMWDGAIENVESIRLSQ